MTVREDANVIMRAALDAAMPDAAVHRALQGFVQPKGKLVLVAAGKAAWQMAKAALDILQDKIDCGAVVTKYDHCKSELPPLELFEAGHPVSDANTYRATERVIEMVQNLTADDTVIFLLSGGGSALFEKPLVATGDLEDLNRQMLACGADIVEINTIRKRLSAVKGGKFAQICAPAKVFSVVLSDIIGDPLDMIASGPAYPDQSTSEAAMEIVRKYNLKLTPEMEALLQKETPKELDNVSTQVTGSVRQLCLSAQETARSLGYTPVVLTASLRCTARDVGSFLASIAQYHRNTDHSLAFIAGGETVVQLTGSGKGGRNQEIALSAAQEISGLEGTAVFSLGSDGTDGPTDAAGGYCDWQTREKLEAQGVSIANVLADNDAYHALEKCDGLIVTGPTGTNVNDLSVLLIKR